MGQIPNVKRYPLGQRLKLFDACITPSVLYGCETWTLTAELQHRLRKTQRHMLRLMLKSGRRKMQQPHDTADVSSSSSSSVSTDDATVHDEPEEVLEPWVDWIQRVTREAEAQMEKANIKSWVELQRRRQHRWAGHVVRMSDGRWTQRILDWQPDPSTGRRQARPRKRWSDDLAAHSEFVTGQTEICWRFQACDRDSWRALQDGFAATE